MIFRKIPVDAAVTLGCAEKAAILNELYHVTLEPGIRQNRNYLTVRFKDWQKAFPWMSLRKVQRYIQELKDLGMIAYTTVYDENGKKGETHFSITVKGVETLLMRRPETYLDQGSIEEESAAAREAMERIISEGKSLATNVTSDASPRHQCRLSTSPVSHIYKNKEQQEGEQQEGARAAQAPEQTAPLPATPQSAGNSEGGEERKPRRAAARTKTPPYPPLSPTLIEWMDHCREKWPLMPAFRAELAFAGYESKGWLRESSKGKFVPIVNWRGATHTSYLNWTKWHADEHTAAKRDQETRARNSQGGPFSERPNRGPFSE